MLRLVALASVLATAPAHAEPPAPVDESASTPDVSPSRRAAAISLAIVPGVFVHGVGSWVVHERPAAKQLFKLELVGAGAIALGGAFVGGTGGNPYTIWPGVPILLAGSGLFLSSWLTDIWVAAGGHRIAAEPRALAPFSVEAGTTWQHDAFRNRALLRAGGRVAIGRVDIGGNALIDAGGEAMLGETNIGIRFFGAPATGELVGDGSRLGARVGLRAHRDDADAMTQLVGELEVFARLDLARLDAVFAPSFLELSTGAAINRVRYDSMDEDVAAELLGRFAWGTYLGCRGEAMLFYDHRRDGLAGGLTAYRAAGFVGSIGATADVRVHGPWAIRGELAVGSAWVTTLAVAYRGGPQ